MRLQFVLGELEAIEKLINPDRLDGVSRAELFEAARILESLKITIKQAIREEAKP